MKKLIIALAIAFALITSPLFVYAADSYVGNLFTGIAKAIVSVPVQLLYTGPKHIAEETNENGLAGLLTGIGDYITRPPVKVIEEVGTGLTGNETRLAVESPGSLNEAIEENPAAHFVRNSVGTWIAVAGIVGPHASWTRTHQAATWTTASVAIGTVADDYIH